MIVIHKMNPAEYSCKLQGFPTAVRLAISRSDVVRLLTGINHGLPQPKLNNCQILIIYCLRGMTSADVCLK